MTRLPALAVALALLGAPALSAHAHEYFADGFKVIHPWSEQTAPEATATPVYMHFEEVSKGDKLVGASTTVAERVEIVDGPDDRVLTAAEIPVPEQPNAVVEFGPGGPHLRLIGLRHQLLWGREYSLRLVFERSGVIDTALSIGQH